MSGIGLGTKIGRRRLEALAESPTGSAMMAAAALLFLACLVNIASTLHDVPAGVAAWKPVTWELSSFCGAMAGTWIVAAAQRAAFLPTHRWGRWLAIHAAAAMLYSGVHCLTMWTLRRLVYTLAGAPYGWSMPAAQLAYEVHKDVFTYVILSALYWCVTRLKTQANGQAPGASVAAVPSPPTRPAMLTIRDGARVVHALLRDILAAEAAGNYVSLLLQDGQQHLTRRTLGQLAADLAPHGFMRVHRSWLVNAAHVCAMEPTGAGDFRLILTRGTVVPLSRRHARPVQERLRQDVAGAPKPEGGPEGGPAGRVTAGNIMPPR
jgi:hypothetical protein